jgi:EmrB/QacA subfamily drug resistance transporter
MVSTKRLIMFTVALALFMDIMDSNIINTAIPAMAASFKVHPIDLKIALISYLLSLALFIPISGWSADNYGTKHIFIVALTVFTISSFACGYAHSLKTLVLARSVQGIGGAFMISLGRLIIAQTFERHQLVKAMNAVIMVVSLAVMLGPFIGGLITEHLSWPWIFWVNIPAGILALFIAFFSIPTVKAQNRRPFDWLGFILFGGSLAILCFALSLLSETQANPPLIMGLLLLVAVMLTLFVFHAKHSAHPVIQIDLFHYRSFRTSVLGNLFCRIGFSGMPFLLPMLQQIALGFSPQLSGLLLVPVAFGIILSKLIAYRLLCYFGYRRFLLINTVLLGLSVMAFQIIDTHTSPLSIACLCFIFGLFSATQYTGMNSLAYAEIQENRFAALNSITSTTQILAQTLGVAVSAILLRFFSLFQPPTNHLSVILFHQSFAIMGIFTLLSAMIFLPLKADDGQQMLQ